MENNEKLLMLVEPTCIRLPYGKLDTSCRFYARRILEDFCKKKLTSFEYVKRVNRFVKDKEYFKHDEVGMVMRIPSAFVHQLEQFLSENFVMYQKELVRAVGDRGLTCELNPEFTPREIQIKPIEYLCDRSSAKRGLELQTGKGKTFIATQVIKSLNEPTIIVVGGLIQQWYLEVKKFLKIPDDKVYVIQALDLLKSYLIILSFNLKSLFAL